MADFNGSVGRGTGEKSQKTGLTPAYRDPVNCQGSYAFGMKRVMFFPVEFKWKFCNTPIMTGRNMPEADTHPRSRSARRLLVAFFLIALGCLVSTVWYFSRPVDLPEGVTQKEYNAAKLRFQKMYRKRPSRIAALSLVGEMAINDGRLKTAAACFYEIPSEDSQYGPSARLQEAQVLVRLNRAIEAERNFRKYLSLASRNPSSRSEHIATAYQWLIFILSVEFRFEDRKVLLAEVHAQGMAGVWESKLMYFPHLLIWHTPKGRQRLTDFFKEDPQNRQLQVAEGRYLTGEGKLEEAEAFLEELHEGRPDDLHCAAALLECLFEKNYWTSFIKVVESLPEYDSREPWLLTQMRGQLALHEERWEDAVRQFEHLLGKDPSNPRGHMSLARAYAELQRLDDRDKILKRSLVIANIRAGLGNVNENDDTASLKLASSCEEIGLREAAEAFRKHALRIRRSHERARTSEKRSP